MTVSYQLLWLSSARRMNDLFVDLTHWSGKTVSTRHFGKGEVTAVEKCREKRAEAPFAFDFL